MRYLIRWYRESQPRLRVVFRNGTVGVQDVDGFVGRSTRRRRILIVGPDNSARSPLAAGLLQKSLGGGEWEVVSAGTEAAEGTPANDLMRTAAAERGIDLSAHRARKVTRDDILAADLVIAMSQAQVDRLSALRPEARRRIRRIAHREIPDPGDDVEFHRDCCRKIEAAVGQLSKWIARREASRRGTAAVVPRWSSTPNGVSLH